MILLLTGCSSYYRKEEDYNYLSNNSIRFIRDDTTCFLINRNDIYYLLYFDYFDSDIYSDYYIDLNDIDSGIAINDLVIKRNDKIEINIDNYNFCIYIKELDRDNYGNCDFLYLYNIDDDFYITLSNDIYILFYDSYTRFNYRFMYHLSLVWVDSYTIDKSSYLTMTIRDNNFIITTDKIRGKTIHKKGKS